MWCRTTRSPGTCGSGRSRATPSCSPSAAPICASSTCSACRSRSARRSCSIWKCISSSAGWDSRRAGRSPWSRRWRRRSAVSLRVKSSSSSTSRASSRSGWFRAGRRWRRAESWRSPARRSTTPSCLCWSIPSAPVAPCRRCRCRRASSIPRTPASRSSGASRAPKKTSARGRSGCGPAKDRSRRKCWRSSAARGCAGAPPTRGIWNAASWPKSRPTARSSITRRGSAAKPPSSSATASCRI